MVALTEWPEEKQRWIDALAGPQGDEVGWIAAEEIVRWSSPVVHMKRNATWDTVLGSEESGLVLLQAFPDIEVCGPVSKSGSLFLNVVTNLPVRYTPT